MERYRVKKTCYGFRNSYYEKGEIIEADPKENPPAAHFELLKKESSEAITPAVEKEPEPQTPAEVERQGLIDDAKAHGIKIEDAKLLTSNELMEVLNPEISRQKITAIIQKAKKRQAK